jgi:hypothetical protein
MSKGISEERRYSLRPLSRTIDDSTLENAFRIFITAGNMDEEDLKQGDYVSLRSENSGAVGIAIVSRSPHSVPGGTLKTSLNPVIRMHDWLRERYSFELQEKYHLEKWTHKFQPIKSIVVSRVTEDDTVNSTDSIKAWLHVALGTMTLGTRVL